ncbi:hypothetical protein SLW70_10755 [Flavobacterium sp. NG2]|uniref:hypothetical protein n=1 Tax=Flavobacterium sp. NG2 TaxID=3097547 RepID=UPI002A81E2A9|nr:hypothetical protein [Flavobacterium sp. NG2]WPR70421.1 hypothetical protein SLW70_10755 [Flavobacterium sp. NG2]
MTPIKFVIVLLFFGFGIHTAQSQTYKFKTSGLSVLEKKQNGKWGNWSNLQLTNILVTLDTNKNRIVVYSEAIQLFNIVTYLPAEENENDTVYSFTCKDNDGIDCTVSIITRKKQGNRKQMYINYGERIILYNIFNM